MEHNHYAIADAEACAWIERDTIYNMEENKIIIYQTEDGQTQIDVRLENETVWLTQAQMAELFQKDRTVITRHINNVFNEGELNREEVCAKFAHTTRHGAQSMIVFAKSR